LMIFTEQTLQIKSKYWQKKHIQKRTKRPVGKRKKKVKKNL